MAKLLKDIIGEANLHYTGNSKDERDFAEKLIAKEPFKNMYSGKDYDHVFKGTTTKQYKRPPMHGYNPGQDEKVYK